jgi:hypothetical protein
MWLEISSSHDIRSIELNKNNLQDHILAEFKRLG